MKPDLPILLPVLLLAVCCGLDPLPQSPDEPGISSPPSLAEVAKVLSCLPIGQAQMQEVYDAVGSSSTNGYDEEYTMKDLLDNPGAGVGDSPTKAGRKTYDTPIRDLLADYYASQPSTKSGSAADAARMLETLRSSDIQIYWPFSDSWDGESSPLITFDPGYGAEANYAYEFERTDSGFRLVDSVLVDERLAMQRPVWVINNNEDSGFTPLDLYLKSSDPAPRPASRSRRLILKSFKMLRNYDSWFAGGSEFVFQVGAVNGFSASTETELRLYYPGISQFTIIVKRSQKGVEIPMDALMLSDFTTQMDKIAFLVTEDDGGTRTSWKCSAVVKIQSKSYGFDLDLPFNEKDDVVWRGQLSAGFFQEEDEVCARFGDVMLTFELL